MIKTLLLLALFITAQSIQAQFLEKIFLKDSVTVYQGWVVEQVPQEYLKILRLKEGDTVRVNVLDIWKIIRVIDKKSIPLLLNTNLEAALRRKGYSQVVYLQIGGQGGLYSLNYDRRFTKSRRDGLGGSIGFSYLAYRTTDYSTGDQVHYRAAALPLGINYLVGKRKGALELGWGTTFSYFRIDNKTITTHENYDVQAFVFGDEFPSIITSAEIAYRWRSYKPGFFFKVGFAPILTPQVVPNFGLSFGYHFQKK